MALPGTQPVQDPDWHEGAFERLRGSDMSVDSSTGTGRWGESAGWVSRRRHSGLALRIDGRHHPLRPSLASPSACVGSSASSCLVGEAIRTGRVVGGRGDRTPGWLTPAGVTKEGGAERNDGRIRRLDPDPDELHPGTGCLRWHPFDDPTGEGRVAGVADSRGLLVGAKRCISPQSGHIARIASKAGFAKARRQGRVDKGHGTPDT